MKKPTKIALGLATLWPLLYMILFFVFIFASIIFMPDSGGQEAGAPVFFIVLFSLHLITMLWILALTVIYMVDVFRNDRVDKDKKVLWAVVLFLGSMFAMPIYWYLYLWRELPAAPVPPPPLSSASASAWTNEARATHGEQEYAPPSSPPNWRE